MQKIVIRIVGLLVLISISLAPFQKAFAYDPYINYQADIYDFLGEDAQDYQALLLAWKEHFSSSEHTQSFQGYDADQFESYICNEITERHNNRIPHPYLCGYYTHNGTEITIVGIKAGLWEFYKTTENDPRYNGKTAIFGSYHTYSPDVPENVVIPDEIDGVPVTAIADGAFGTSRYADFIMVGEYDDPSDPSYYYASSFLKIRSLEIGNNVRTIGADAFTALRRLRSVRFGKNVQTIGDHAFDGCGFLRCISDWGEHLEVIGDYAFFDTDAYYFYDDGGTFQMPPLPDTLRIIGASAFACITFDGQSLMLPSSVLNLSSTAFKSTGLNALTVLSPHLQINRNGWEQGLLGYAYQGGTVYCYAGSTVEADAKQYGYTYALIDGESLMYDGQTVEGDTLVLPQSMGEDAFLARASSDGAECAVRLSGLVDGNVTDGTTVTLWNTRVDAEGKVYTVQCAEGVQAAGDTDGSGAVSLADVALLTRYLAGGWNVTIRLSAADVNKDGFVNLKDVTLLRRYIAGGWGVVLK